MSQFDLSLLGLISFANSSISAIPLSYETNTLLYLGVPIRGHLIPFYRQIGSGHQFGRVRIELLDLNKAEKGSYGSILRFTVLLTSYLSEPFKSLC